MARAIPQPPSFSRRHLPPGTRLGLAVSGGADSVALLRLAHRLAPKEGWTLQVLHLQHGLRGDESRADAVFVAELAATLELPLRSVDRDTHACAAEHRLGLEETGRTLRYAWFRSLLAEGDLDVIATGHTLDDQAETVLARMLRGAWTSGLAGIYSTVAAQDLPHDLVVESPPHIQPAAVAPRGWVVRPLLEVRRDALRAWLTAIGQSWREDSSNADLQFSRNRIRHAILPVLRPLNPQVDEHLAHTAELAQADEHYWQAETARLLPALLLPGRPVRGGGRASSTLSGERSLAIEVERLRSFPLALQRRLLRAIAAQLGAALDYDATARVIRLLEGPVGSTARREQLVADLRAERTPRELRFLLHAAAPSQPPATVIIPIPGMGTALGVTLALTTQDPEAPSATLRAAVPADRVRLRHSSGAPKRIKEVLERMGVPPPDRARWPVLEWQGEIVWVKGAVLEPTPVSSRLTIQVQAQAESA
jgi:tRNA(Ile)-lysidine synthase